MQWKKRREFLRRGLRLENLESRSLLAGLIGESPWQNPLDANDLDCDGDVSPSDALVAINAINSGVSGELAAHFAPPQLDGDMAQAAPAFWDADGDGNLSASDALTVINVLNSHQRGAALGHSGAETEPNGSIEEAQEISLTHGFGRVRGVITDDTDVDVYKVEAVKSQLNLAVFYRGSGTLTVVFVDGTTGDPIDDLPKVMLEEGTRRPTKVTLDVEPGVHYLQVTATGDAGSGGPYALALLNFDELTFTPPPDSPPGQDDDGDRPDDATEHHRDHVPVVINRNETLAAGEEDEFTVEAKSGKLIVAADAAFDLDISITNLDDPTQVLPSFSTADRNAVVVNVTEGTYQVSVTATNDSDAGDYHLHVVNVARPIGGDHQPPDHPGLPTLEGILAKLDADGDGVISDTEFEEGVPGGHTRIADRIFESWDADGNGELSEEEITAGLSTFPPLFPTPTNHDPPAGLIARVRGLRLDAG